METEKSLTREEKYVSTSHAQSSLLNMQNLYASNKLTDVTLIVSDTEICAHRLVLSAASDYFAAMFTSDLKESTVQHVPLKGADPVATAALVEFCYTGEINLTEENVETILSTANLLQIQEVVKACCNFLASRLHPSNCIGFSMFSESQGCMDLHQTAYTYIMDHFMAVVPNQEYLSLSADDVGKLLSSDMLNVPSEEKAFEALMFWVNHDLPSRKKEFPRLLEMIKLPLLSPEYLADHVEMEPLVKENNIRPDLILEAMRYHLLPTRRTSILSKRIQPRKSTVGTLFMIGGMDGLKGSWRIDNYDFRTNTWNQYGTMNSRRLQFGAAVIDDKLYVIGGREGLKTLNVVECYDLVTKSWVGMPSMSTHRHGLGVAVLKGPMYAVGGHDGWTYLNTVERWDTCTRQWSYVSSLNTQRSTAGVAVMNEKLYAVGGRDGSSCLRSVECFDPHRNKWTFCSPMSIKRGGAGVGVINNYLFVLGGHDAPILNPGVSRFQCVERYDPLTDCWTMVAPMKLGRDAIGVGILGDLLIAVGGYDGQTYLKIVEAYDPKKDEWTELKELEEGKAGMCIVVAKNI